MTLNSDVRRIPIFVVGMMMFCVRAGTLSCSTLNVTLDPLSGAVVKMETVGGMELFSGSSGMGLFQVKCVRTDDFQQKGDVFPCGASCREEKIPQGFRYVYSDFPHPMLRRAEVTVRAVGNDIRWTISYESETGWAVTDVEFPKLPLNVRLGESGADDRFLYGTAKGGLYHSPGSKPVGWALMSRQPGSLSAQFGTYYDSHGGVYFASEDNKGYTKEFVLCRAKDCLYVDMRRHDFETGVSSQPFEFVTRGLDSDGVSPIVWQDAADIYRVWAEQQAWCAKRYRERMDIPRWMKEGPTMTRFYRDWVRNPDVIRKWMSEFWMRRYAGVPLIVALWGWEKHGDWIGPDYFPVVCGDDAFKCLCSELLQQNAHPFPWPSGYHWTLMSNADSNGSGHFEWDDRERFRRLGASHAVVNSDGMLYERDPGWYDGGKHSCLCAGDPWTQDYINREVGLPLSVLGCDMIQMDQVVGGSFPPCWSRQHSHPPNEGEWKTRVFMEQLISLKRTMAKVVEFPVVCMEEPNEMANGIVGIQDYRDCESGADEWAGVFTYLYHEYLPCFQSNPIRGDLKSMSYQAVNGQIPFFSAMASDSEAGRPVIVNGGFGAVDPQGIPFGWNQVRRYEKHRWNGRVNWSAGGGRNGGAAVCLETTAVEGGVQIAQNVSCDDEAFVPGGHYRVSAWLKTVRSADASQARFQLFMPGIAKFGGTVGTFPETSNEWVRVSGEYELPESPGNMRIIFHVGSEGTYMVGDVTLDEIREDGTIRPVMLSGRGRYQEYMRRWVEMYRGRGRPYLVHGRSVKPPRVEGVEWDDVFCSAYVAEDGSEAVVLGNATMKRQEVVLIRKARRVRIMLEPNELKLIERSHLSDDKQTKET